MRTWYYNIPCLDKCSCLFGQIHQSVGSHQEVKIRAGEFFFVDMEEGTGIFILRMGFKAVGRVCCVMHVKEPSYTCCKEKGFALVFLAVSAECAAAPL